MRFNMFDPIPELLFNIFDSAHTEFLLNNHMYVRPGDIFNIISGNNATTVNPTFVNQQAQQLRTLYPTNPIYAYTAGTVNPNNMQTISQVLNPNISGILYGYEPNMANEPEFTWDFNTTLTNVSTASSIAHAVGKMAGMGATGRPLLETDLQQYNWDYDEFLSNLDFLLVQTQTYAHDGVAIYMSAIGKLDTQTSTDVRWCPQISIGLSNSNGVLGDDAYTVYANAPTSILSVWANVSDLDELANFLQLAR